MQPVGERKEVNVAGFDVGMGVTETVTDTEGDIELHFEFVKLRLALPL